MQRRVGGLTKGKCLAKAIGCIILPHTRCPLRWLCHAAAAPLRKLIGPP